MTILPALLLAAWAGATPPPEPTFVYFRQADIVANGDVTSLRIQTMAPKVFKISFTFKATRFWKGEDRAKFDFYFDAYVPEGSVRSLRDRYAQNPFVFFYKKWKTPKGNWLRESVYITPLNISLERELSDLKH